MKFSNCANEIERQIAVSLVEELLAEGFELRVHDGGEFVTEYTKDEGIIFAAMCSTDEDRVWAKRGRKEGWVWLIWGNRGDLISDFTVNLNPHITKTEEFATRF
jgi:hypothetical protein